MRSQQCPCQFSDVTDCRYRRPRKTIRTEPCRQVSSRPPPSERGGGTAGSPRRAAESGSNFVARDSTDDRGFLTIFG
ncbi:unnamed protein product, partial [Nesidiocoris tenuis]